MYGEDWSSRGQRFEGVYVSKMCSSILSACAQATPLLSSRTGTGDCCKLQLQCKHLSVCYLSLQSPNGTHPGAVFRGEFVYEAHAALNGKMSPNMYKAEVANPLSNAPKHGDNTRSPFAGPRFSTKRLAYLGTELAVVELLPLEI